MKRVLVVAVAFCVATVHAGGGNGERAAAHVLNRIAFGPRPGDVERVRSMGITRYIDQQLHPERLADRAIAARLAPLTTIGMTSREIAESFEAPLIQARRARQAAAADPNAPPVPAPPAVPANRVLLDLEEQKILRAVYSERQLQEVLTDFWFNHFNVDARKGPDRFLLTEYEREAIRPHVLGRFRDLLEATAHSPAMLFYLDNWMSVAENAGAVMRQNRRGLNENYARELMELHTLGVDGGFTQKDVTEVARAFTGWTIDNPRQRGGFRFQPRSHDAGEKIVLGHRIKAGGGGEDGEQVLDVLADHPATARFIATKLVRRFVSDDPPASLVSRVAARFRATRGDLREVIRTILTSSEFTKAERARVKTPFEFVVSAVRVSGAEVRDARLLVRALQELGMPLYQCQPPTGYKETTDAWVNTGALVSRMNFAAALASNQLRGVTIGDPDATRRLLEPWLSDSTRRTVAQATTSAQALALTLGAPEFQRR